MSIIDDKAVLTAMIERDVGNLYENLRSQILSITGKNKVYKQIVDNYIKSNERSWLQTLQDYCDQIVETSFPSPDTTLNEAIGNANNTINTVISQFLQEKLNIPENVVTIGLQTLLGITV